MTLKFDVKTISSSLVNEGGSDGGSGVKRGSWSVPQSYLDLEKAVENFEWNGDTYTNFIHGIILPKGISTIWIDIGSYNSFLTSEGYFHTMASEESGEGVLYTYNNADADNWIVFENDLDYVSYTPRVYCVPGNNKTTWQVDYLRYLVTRYPRETVYDQSTHSHFDYFLGLAKLESVKLINYKYGGKFSGNDLRGACRKYIPDISYWSDPTPADNFTSYFKQYAHTCPNLPRGLDLSNITSDLTLGTTDKGMNNIEEAYIILPNSNFTITERSGISFTLDNWSYIADNAPVVEGKTLTMGALNIAICGGTDGEIITKLINKGWTVA